MSWNIQDIWRRAYPNDCNFTFQAESGQQQIKSRLDRIYVRKNIQQYTFGWKIEASSVPMDHQLVQMRYTPNDALHMGRGHWTQPLGMIDDLKTTEKIIQCRIKLQEDMTELKNTNTDCTMNNLQLLQETFKEEIKKIARSQNKKAYHKMTMKICNLEKDQASVTAHPDPNEREDL